MEEKKNTSKNIIIAILVILVLLLSGFIVYDKVINEKVENDDNSSVVEKETMNLESAKKLIDKYYLDTYPEHNTFIVGMTENMKKEIVMDQVPKKSILKRSCESIKGFKEENGECVSVDENSFDITYGSEIQFEVLNAINKELFGKSENFEKKDFDIGLTSWRYDATSNSFIAFTTPRGMEFGPFYSNYFVKNVEENKGSLKVKVGYLFLKNIYDDFDDEALLSTNIKGENVTYKYSDTQKNTFEEELKKKYLDKLDTYEFTFKFEDDHYVFVDLKKID